MLLTIQELLKAQCNNTDINNTDYSDTDPFLIRREWKRTVTAMSVDSNSVLFLSVQIRRFELELVIDNRNNL